jgi:hypothetical protein
MWHIGEVHDDAANSILQFDWIYGRGMLGDDVIGHLHKKPKIVYD